MNWEAVVAIVAILECVRGVLIYFLIAPLRGLKEKVTQLTNAGFEAEIAKLHAADKVHDESIAALQMFRAGSFGEAVKVFTTRQDFDDDREMAARSRELLTDKVDQGLRNDAAQTRHLDLIQRQLDRLLERT